MKSTLTTLPKPSPEAIALSNALTQEIHSVIKKSGPIPFSQFMQMALYHGQLGYYQNDLKKFGESGDFVTAPEISPLFSHCLANQYLELAEKLQVNQIIEFGAGSGRMALDILHYLKQINQLPEQYLIIETSPSLQERQKQLLQSQLPEYFSHIQWLSALPEQFEGIILGNEVMDAMPVDLYQKHQENIVKAYVDAVDGELTWLWQTTEDVALPKDEDYQEGYAFEYNAYLSPWVASLSDCLKKGGILLVDYGYPKSELLHPQRTERTFTCHYRHHTHDDPLSYIGLQDLTAHVDFTDLVEAAEANNLVLAGYTTQAQFLMGAGLLEFAASLNTVEQLNAAQQIKTLTLPSEMGERFQVMALCTEEVSNLRGFVFDLSHRL